MNWLAKWIWGNLGDNDKNSWVCFRKAFEYECIDGCESAILKISADSRYFLYINGLYMGTGPARCWPFEQSYDSFEIRYKLKSGLNVIAVLVNHYGTSTSQYVQGRGGLIVQTDFYSGGGIIDSIYTSENWASCTHIGYARNVCRINVAQPWMEVFDAGAFDENWIYPGYDDLLWEKSFVIGPVGTEPWESMLERDIPQLAVEETYAARVVSHRNVKTVGQHRCVDIRSNFFPDCYDSIDKKLLGYMASIIISPYRMTGKIRLICRKWPETEERMKLNGKEYIFAPDEDVKEVSLESGENLLLIDVSGYHQRFTMNYYFDFCAKIDFSAPLFGSPYEFVTIGPFESGDVLNIAAVGNPIDYENAEYRKVWRINGMEDIAHFSQWMQPIPEDCIMNENPHILSMLANASSIEDVTENICNMIIANDVPAVIYPTKDADTEIIVDFGKEISAFIFFDIECQAGTIIDMDFVESIHDGIIEYSPDLNNSLRYVAKAGRQQYRSFLRRGFRYCIVTVRNLINHMNIFLIKGYQSNYPVVQSGSFKCSDWQMNEIWKISSRSVLLCMEDTFVDCPAYEQAYWIGDARNEALIGYYTFGAYDLMKRCIKLVTGSLRHSELPEAQIPTGCNTVLTAWVLLWIISCKEYYDFSGDLKGVSRIYSDIIKVIYNLLRYVNAENLLEISGWNMLDWARMDTPTSGVITHQNALLVKVLKDIASLASLMEDIDTREMFHQKAELISQAINKYLWDEKRGAFIDSIHSNGEKSSVISMQTNIMIYICDCAEGGKKGLLEKYLLDPPEDFIQVGTPFMSFFYFEALSRLGRKDMIIEKIREGWGNMLKYDATTCWEAFPGFEKKRLTRSHCHGWSAAPGYFLGASILGVKPLRPGFEEIVIEPAPCGLEWAKGAVPTPHGLVYVDWKLEDGVYHIKVSTPKNCNYIVRMNRYRYIVEGEI